ncbi:MAG: sigma 54-interacting transcriptional regulator, partial [Candidatus Stygibacter frigidus]|nr:sigma 54-interacting transcriptional regulator [Candidatus Stygibacter frigidus]
LRLLENGVIQKVGSEIQKVDVRVIAAANNDLEEQVKKGQFRQDLLFRLNVLQITVPPLREHKEDIPELAKHFLRQDCTKEGLEYKELSAEAMSLLLNSNWQGNIRELKNVIDRCIVQTASSTIIKEADIKRAFQGKAIIKKKTLKGATAEFEKEFLINNLLINNWNVAKTADKIGIDRSNLHKKIKHYDIKVRKD